MEPIAREMVTCVRSGCVDFSSLGIAACAWVLQLGAHAWQWLDHLSCELDGSPIGSIRLPATLTQCFCADDAGLPLIMGWVGLGHLTSLQLQVPAGLEGGVLDLRRLASFLPRVESVMVGRPEHGAQWRLLTTLDIRVWSLAQGGEDPAGGVEVHGEGMLLSTVPLTPLQPSAGLHDELRQAVRHEVRSRAPAGPVSGYRTLTALDVLHATASNQAPPVPLPDCVAEHEPAHDVQTFASLLARGHQPDAQHIDAAHSILEWARHGVLRYEQLPTRYFTTLQELTGDALRFLDAFATRQVPGGVKWLQFGTVLTRHLMRPASDFLVPAHDPRHAPRLFPHLGSFPGAAGIGVELPPSRDFTSGFDLRGVEPQRVLDIRVEIELPPQAGKWLVHLPRGIRVRARSEAASGAPDASAQRVKVCGWFDGGFDEYTLEVGRSYRLGRELEPPVFALGASGQSRPARDRAA